MDKCNIKSQAAVQFMILVGVLLFVFVIFLGVVADRVAFTNKEKVGLRAQDVVTMLQKEIILASQMLDGYERTITLPDKIESKEYVIGIVQQNIVLTVEGADYTAKIPVVNGTFTIGQTTIRKQQGGIYLS